MKNITTESNWVRVIGNTADPDNKEMNEMIGKEGEVDCSHYRYDTIFICDEDTSRSWCFNKKDVRFLTAGMHNKKHIAIGDEVLVYGSWKKVMGFYVYDGTVKIQTGTPEDTLDWCESLIIDHRTEEPPLSGTQVTVTIDGKDYPAIII